MKLEQAIGELSTLCGKSIDSIIQGLPPNLRHDKGKVGKLLELHLGLQLGTNHTDFEDAELKTNKVKSNGKPEETIAITQITGDIDSLISDSPVAFEQSRIYTKIKNLVIVPVIKEGLEKDWRFGHIYQVDFEKDVELRQQLHSDYDSIVGQLNLQVSASGDGFIHTSNGAYLQIRSKAGSPPYLPIYSNYLKRNVANKYHAFYFRKQFMLHLRDEGPKYRLCQH